MFNKTVNKLKQKRFGITITTTKLQLDQ